MEKEKEGKGKMQGFVLRPVVFVLPIAVVVVNAGAGTQNKGSGVNGEKSIEEVPVCMPTGRGNPSTIETLPGPRLFCVEDCQRKGKAFPGRFWVSFETDVSRILAVDY